MNKNPRLIFTFGILIVSILACNLPGSQSNSQPNLAATITAQAMLLETPTATLASQTQTPAATGPEVSMSATITPPAMSESQTNTPKPTKTPKPTATLISLPPTLPAPSNLSGSRTCAKALNGLTPIWKETYTLTWTVNTTLEAAYKVYMNNTLIGTGPANLASFSDSFQYDQQFSFVHPSKDAFRVDLYYSITEDEGFMVVVAPGPTVDISRCP
ncbi:MAG TPA: hypothetical protein VLX61_14115 [Anaerolineales bacterium]|nr:hypothetical protein [Anaerolineales bacterium]